MKKTKKILALLMTLIMIFAITACGSSGDGEKKDSGKSEEKTATEELANLDGENLMIYCGAGMKAPFTKIVEKFEKETGCKVDLTFGNGAQINSQITTAEKGDLFIAGAPTELENLKNKNFVTESKDLVKHIPVIAVPKGNPAGIKSLKDLANGKTRLVLADAQATPIGKIANKMLQNEGIFDSVNIVARTSTAPEMINALSTGEADAAVVWKENAQSKEGIEILDIPEMEKYIKVVPAASLSCSENPKALKEFLKYLDSDAVHKIWEKAGYEVLK